MIFNYALPADNIHLQSDQEKKISRAEYAEEVFQVDTIDLQVPIKFDYGKITTIMVTNNNSIVIAFIMHPAILLFNSEGKFIRKIGRKGIGPGEFQMAWYLTECQNQIVVGEASSRRISFFDMNGEFKHLVRTKISIINSLCTAQDSILVINEITSAKYKKENNVYLLSQSGDMINKFGKLSNWAKKIKIWKSPYSPDGPLAVAYENYIFHANFCDHYIWKYNLNGELLEKFDVKPDNWRYIPEINKEINYMNYKEYSKEFHRYSKINWLIACPPGFLLADLQQEETFENNIRKIMIYTIDGKRIHPGLIIKTFQHYDDQHELSLRPLEGWGFAVLIRSYNKEQELMSDNNDTIIIRMLKFTLPREYE